MSPTVALDHIVGVVADEMGITPQEVWVLGAAVVAVTISAVATRGLIRFVDFAIQG